MTAPATHTAATGRLDPGKARSLRRATTEDGFFEVLAIDHLHDFAWLLNPDETKVPFEQMVRAKDQVIRAVGNTVSAVLVDARYGIGHLLGSGAVGRDTGLMTAIEEEGYRFPAGPRTTTLRPGWSMRQAKLAGADLAKLLWFYRPGTPVSGRQVELVERLVSESAEWSLPLVVEPIWYPLPGEDPDSAAWRVERAQGIVEAVVLVDSLGVDVLKVEFPGDVATAAGRDAARAACTEITRRTTAPWTILSAGVGFEDFCAQLEIACRAGASGYVAGRSVWRDAVGGGPEAMALVRERLEQLNRITRECGRPYVAGTGLDEALAELGPTWYETWHAAA